VREGGRLLVEDPGDGEGFAAGHEREDRHRAAAVDLVDVVAGEELHGQEIELSFRRANLAGSSYRSVEEPADVVRGFMADRLSRPDFLDEWVDSGKKLRP